MRPSSSEGMGTIKDLSLDLESLTVVQGWEKVERKKGMRQKQNRKTEWDGAVGREDAGFSSGSEATGWEDGIPARAWLPPN